MASRRVWGHVAPTCWLAHGVPAAPPARPLRHRAVEGEPAPERRCGLLRRSLREMLHKHLTRLFRNEEPPGRRASRGPTRRRNALGGAGRAPGAAQVLWPRSTWPTSTQAPLQSGALLLRKQPPPRRRAGHAPDAGAEEGEPARRAPLRPTLGAKEAPAAEVPQPRKRAS